MNTDDLLNRIELDWSRERPDLTSLPMLTIIPVQRVSALLDRELGAFFSRFDLTPASFDVLATLRRSAPVEGLQLSQLSNLMAITPPAVTKRVDNLEARGWVQRADHATDRRAFLVRLTERGRALVDEVLPHHVENEERLLAPLSQDERALLRTLLVKLAQSIEAS